MRADKRLAGLVFDFFVSCSSDCCLFPKIDPLHRPIPMASGQRLEKEGSRRKGGGTEKKAKTDEREKRATEWICNRETEAKE